MEGEIKRATKNGKATFLHQGREQALETLDCEQRYELNRGQIEIRIRQKKKKKNGKDSQRPWEQAHKHILFSLFSSFGNLKSWFLSEATNARRKKVHPRVRHKQTTSVYSIQLRTTAHVRGKGRKKSKQKTHTWSIQIH
jgi:hypothetical protein